MWFIIYLDRFTAWFGIRLCRQALDVLGGKSEGWDMNDLCYIQINEIIL